MCGRVCICLNVGSCGSRNVWHADPLGLASGPSAGGVVTSLYWCESESWICCLKWPLPPAPAPLVSFRYSKSCNSVRDVLKYSRCSGCWFEKWIKCLQLANSPLLFCSAVVLKYFLFVTFLMLWTPPPHPRPYSNVLGVVESSTIRKMRKGKSKCEVVLMQNTKSFWE